MQTVKKKMMNEKQQHKPATTGVIDDELLIF